MITVSLFDPPMCCSTGVCGPVVDPTLLRITEMLQQIKSLGATVERYNLAQQPAEFARNPEVKRILNDEGTAALPLMFIDGELFLKGRYPEESERAALLQRIRSHSAPDSQ